MKKGDYIINQMALFYPDAHCELKYANNFQLAVAVILSAQTSDKAVNQVSEKLFLKYPDSFALSKASISEIESYIKSLGLYHNKAKSLYILSKQVSEMYNGQIPNNKKELLKLAGIGTKSANVILSECFNIPSLAVDTHVTRLAKRLKLAKIDDNVQTIEEKLKKNISKQLWIKAHHTMIFYGRYKCKAIKPNCTNCPFISFCLTYNNKL